MKVWVSGFLFVLTFCFLYFLYPDDLLYTKSLIFRWIPLILILALSYLMYQFLYSLGLKKKPSQSFGYLSVLVFGFSWGFMQEDIAEKELKKYGRITTGIVVERFYRTGKSRNEYLVQSTFTIKQKTYRTFTQQDLYENLTVGDTIFILYSELNPENNLLINSMTQDAKIKFGIPY